MDDDLVLHNRVENGYWRHVFVEEKDGSTEWKVRKKGCYGQGKMVV